MNRWQDRFLTGTCALVLALVAAVWALTWRGTEEKVQAVEGRVGTVEQKQGADSERVRALEETKINVEKRFDRIDTTQHEMNRKLDTVILELKK